MGLHTELEFEKCRKVVRSPKIGRPSHCHGSKAEERDEKGKPPSRSDLLRSRDDDFTEISFSKSRSSSFKSIPSGPAGVTAHEAIKRGSIYQSSKEVRKMKKMGALAGPRKIELSRSSDSSLSFRIIDSLSQLDKTSPLVEQKRSSLMSLNADSNPTSVCKTCIESNPPDLPDMSFRFPSTPGCVAVRDISSDGSFEICMDSKDKEHCSATTMERSSMEQQKLRCDQTIGPLNDGNVLSERDIVLTLHKSSSEKVGMHHLPCRSESDHSKASPKAHFNPFRRILDPIMKSKTQRSLSMSVAELGDVTTAGWASMRRNGTLRKSVSSDFSNSTHKTESGTRFVKKDHHSSVVASSAVHLHGLLKLEIKHGVPFFEFSVKDPEAVLAAKTWRADNSFNWVYTFHSLSSRRKSNSSGWGTKERQKEPSMVGQMQVSCYLFSEMRNDGAFNNSMVTEFVLYDIVQARKSRAAPESSYCSTDSVKTTKVTSGESLGVGGGPFESKDVSDTINHKLQLRRASHTRSTDDYDASTHYPWAPSDLHPNLEIAAIVIQVPFEKRESLKDKQGENVGGKEHLNLFDFSAVDQRIENINNGISLTNVKVVTPAGTHGLPSTDVGGGPSPLLDRWRSGGGCDCGGWDTACPLVVFENASVQNMADRPFKNQQPLELFLQGANEKIPALTMTVIDEGQYSVDFHAQLSTLQAFSICVSILHSSEVSTAGGQEKNKQRLQCSSLKVLLEEEMRFLIEAVAEEEKRKVTKRTEEIPPSFIVNPPISPIARV